MYPGAESAQAPVVPSSLSPSGLQQPPAPVETAPLALFQRVYLFAVDRMYKSRADAEGFAKRYIHDHGDHDFARFERVLYFATKKMYMSRADAESFGLRWLRDHPDNDFSSFESAYLFAVEKMYKSRSDAEAFALETTKTGPRT